MEKSKYSKFVDYVIKLCSEYKGNLAKFKRADNSSTEYQSWELLAPWVKLDREEERLTYATISSAIAKSKITENGNTALGKAIACCYDDGSKSDPAKAKLRRLLSCDSVQELCRILHPLFNLIDSRGNIKLDYASLLRDILKFTYDDQDAQSKIKARWAQDFYNNYNSEQPSNENGVEK
jgi:CRISPR system Cascade subunit CasB